MITWDSVDLPDPFGPITAWTSPLRTTRSIPLRISLPVDRGPQAFDAQLVGRLGLAHAITTSTSSPSMRDLVDRHGLGGREGVRACRRSARSSCRASSTRSRGCRCAPRPRTARSWRGCRCRRRRSSRRRCAPGRSGSCRRRTAGPGPGRCRSSERTSHRPLASTATAGRLADGGADHRVTSRRASMRSCSSGTTAGTGNWSSTSAKKPATISRSATAGRHAAALEVEALVLVDRADGRGVRAAHVVVLDLEVRHRLGPRLVRQLDVAVGLEGVGAPGLLAAP